MQWVVLGVVGLVALFLISTYNRLVTLRIRVDNSWSQIDIQLKRRYELIPNLVNTVKGYAKHEKDLFQRVTQARADAINAKDVVSQSQAENELTQTLRSVFAVAENYPELKSDGSFQKLQEELANTENKIAFSRQFYNDTVMKYNQTTQTFPSNVIASIFGFTARSFFEVDSIDTNKVIVDFKDEKK